MIAIRELRIEDYDALIALWNAAGLSHRPHGRDRRDHIAREIAGPCSIFLVATDNGRIVGSVLGTHDGRKGWINRLAVHPDYQRRGIAAQLVSAVEQRLEAVGIDIVAALIEDWNTVSQTVFDKIGYYRHEDIHYYSKRKSPEV